MQADGEEENSAKLPDAVFVTAAGFRACYISAACGGRDFQGSTGLIAASPGKNSLGNDSITVT